MFLLTFTVVNMAPNRQRLENDVFTVGGIAQKYNCALKRLDWQQEQAFVSALTLGYNELEIQRGMTTSSTAIFIPFMTRELRMGGQALYYGMNALSHNVIMADRKKLKSANGMYLGSTGSGKSFAAKRELLNVFLATNDRIVIVDPMGEYVPLARRLGAQVIEIAPDSPNHLNPMDIQLNMNGGESPLSMKADFLLSLCELILGGKEGLQPIERTVIDRCVRQVYREMALGLENAKTPLLQDLYEELLKQPEPEAKRVATALELYCTGSLNLFNHHTNVQTSNRVVCIVLKGMGENLRKIAMHITNEFVTQAVDENYRAGVATWCYFDEFHVLLRDQLTASYFVAVWKMLRKKGCVPSALTQNVKDLLASAEMGHLLYALFLAGLVLGKLIRRPFELFPDGDALGLGFVQHLPGVFRKTGRHSVGLSRLEEKQIFVRPGFVKGVVHIPLPGYPVKYLGCVHLDTAGGRAVGHELFYALFSVGRLGLPAGLGNLTANGPERIGKAPGR